MITLDIVFESEELIVINKPHGLLTHRTRMAADAKEFALQMVRDYVGSHVHPVHRLDRKTSGLLVFAKSVHINAELQKLFRERKVHKEYIAIVRGYIKESDTIDYALKNGDKLQNAITNYTRLETYELPIASASFHTSRYSLVSLFPQTGRYHQLRKHMAHIFHPIIGDRPHGCNKQNKIWKAHFNMNTMLLHAKAIHFEHPLVGKIKLEATESMEFNRALQILRNPIIKH